jgi:hypothetical protein
MANRIIIPNEFVLNNKKIIVEFNNEYCKDAKAWGLADFEDHTIFLTTMSHSKRLKKSDIDKTFFHELAHMLLHSIGSNKLKWNEDFVEKLGIAIYQFERTKK